MSDRRRSGQLEERKRGQRLFGALLGTLSQSSSSTAQKRRSDIEKKQQAKLRLQTEEENEKKKAKLDALMEVRRQEQKIFDAQSVRSSHQRASLESYDAKERPLDANSAFKSIITGALSTDQSRT